ncbi:hypothetical protein [Mariprofundus sp. KV]|uniref:hypothetical protein n=1 Tax=Mariprofundus sp. KV TaxID=2608715 RepID=UPI00159F90A5|nr:hypothetical protein [Mariprofundus sp. KV]NWF36166.1 hypothetical protein [Mariprofundus sp. KV]
MSECEEKIIPELDENQSLEQVVSVQLHQLAWPEGLSQQVPLELLEWIIFEDFSASVLTTAANRRIHVIPKPKMRTNKSYIVVGGYISYLVLMKTAWDKDITCDLNLGSNCNDIQSFHDDLYLGLSAVKCGPVFNAAKAAIIQDVMSMGEGAKCVSGSYFSSRYLKKSPADLFKSLTGYVPKSFKMTGKKDVPNTILSSITEKLDLKKSNAKSSDTEKNVELEGEIK